MFSISATLMMLFVAQELKAVIVQGIGLSMVFFLILAGPRLGRAQAVSTDAGGLAQVGHGLLDDADFIAQVKQGMIFLYNVQFEDARSIFEQASQHFPEHPVGPFLEAVNTWWMIQIDHPDLTYDARFNALIDEVLQRSNAFLKKDKHDQEAKYLKSAALGLRAQFRTRRQSWLGAASDGKDSFDYIEELVEEDPDNDDIYYGLGVYDYYVPLALERYPILKPILIIYPEGNKERGITRLERVMRNGRFGRVEAAFALAKIFLQYEKTPARALGFITWLRTEFPDNPLFHTFEGQAYFDLEYWQEARRIYQEVLERHHAGKRGYNQIIGNQARNALRRVGNS